MTNPDFARTLSLLRQEKGISQRQAAKTLGISQALLSHYENGAREPGLMFVVKACDFYNVSADFLLGRTLSRDGTTILDADTLYDVSDERDNVMQGSVIATLSKKLVVNSVGLLFDLLSRVGSKKAIRAAAVPAKYCPVKAPAMQPDRAIATIPASSERAHAPFVMPRLLSMAVRLFSFPMKR